MGASVSRREGGVRLCGYRERSLGSSPADLPSAGPGPSGPLNKKTLCVLYKASKKVRFAPQPVAAAEARRRTLRPTLTGMSSPLAA